MALLQQTNELMELVKGRISETSTFYGGSKKFEKLHPSFTLLFEGYKDTYNPAMGGVSIANRLNKVVFASLTHPGNYVVLLESGSYLVSSSRFITTKPFKGNQVLELGASVL